jgi:hypothetical protein
MSATRSAFTRFEQTDQSNTPRSGRTKGDHMDASTRADHVNIHDIPFAGRFKTGKLYKSLDDLAALINGEVAAGDQAAKRAEGHAIAASIHQNELDGRQTAMITARTELIRNVAAGRAESNKMDALPPQDREEVVEIVLETAEAYLAERKETNTLKLSQSKVTLSPVTASTSLSAASPPASTSQTGPLARSKATASKPVGS